MRTYTGNDRSKVKNSANYSAAQRNGTSVALSQKQMAAISNTQGTNKTSIQTRKSSQAGSSVAHQISKKAVIAQAKQQNKTIQEKYEELEFKYNELLELVENKKNDEDQPNFSKTPMTIENMMQRDANQASLSSISSKGLVSVNRQIQMAQQANSKN